METFRFFNFQVYQEAKGLYQEILLVSKKITVYSLKDQLIRSSLSVVLSIAEGSAKQSDKDFARYLQISLGSINEMVACFDIMRDSNFLSVEEHKSFLKKAEEIAKQLGGFIKKLHNS